MEITEINGWTVTPMDDRPNAIEMRKGKRSPLIMEYQEGMVDDVVLEYATLRIVQAEMEDEARSLFPEGYPFRPILDALYNPDPHDESNDDLFGGLELRKAAAEAENEFTIRARTTLASSSAKLNKLRQKAENQLSYSRAMQEDRRRKAHIARLKEAAKGDSK